MSERNYTVKTINGYRRQNLSREEALTHAERLRHRMIVAGWRGPIEIVYQPTGAVITRENVGGR